MTAFTFIHGDTIQWVAVLIDAAAKGLVVLLLAAGATLLLRRSSAALRHMTWTLSIAALILVPFLSLALPQLQVPLLPDWAGTGGPARMEQTVAQSPAVAEHLVGTGGQGAESVMPAGDWPLPAGARQPVHPADAALETPAAPVLAAAAPQPPPMHWPAWVLLAWLAGAAALLLPLLAGTVIVWRQARRAERINSGSWVHLLDELRPQLGVRGRVVLLRSNWPNIPLTCGIFRPAIILPAEADNWPADRRRVVLLHELAHIRRRDCLTQLLARLARVIYWFNPLVWLAGRMLRIEREQACDDLVLASGHKASDYAGHLLEIVRSLHSVRCPSLAAVAMARRSQFEGRLLAILDPRRNRRSLTRWGLLIAVLLAVAVAIPLAILRAAESSKPDIQQNISQLQSNDESVWKPAVGKLIAIGPSVAEPLAELFAKGGPGDAHAMQVLEGMAANPEVQALMRKGLDSKSPNVVHCSMLILGKSGNQEHAKTIAALLERNTIAACIALSELGGEEAFQALVSALNKPNIEPRWLVVEQLARLGKPGAIPGIKEALTHLTGEELATAQRYVAAIHKLEGDGSRPGLTSFSSFHAMGDRNWSLLEGINLGKMVSVYIQPFQPKGTVEQTRTAAYQALTAEDGLDLAWDQYDGNRLLAINGVKLAPYTPALPKGYDVWSDGERFLDQRQLAKTVETYNAGEHVLEVEERVRAYPFKPRDYFLASLPDGRVAIIRTADVWTKDENVCVRLAAKVLDPLYQLIPASAFATKAAKPATQPAGSRLEFRIAPSASSLTNAERDSYMDGLKAGRVGPWWETGEKQWQGQIPVYMWLPFAGDMANVGNMVMGEYKGQKYVLVSDKPGQTMVTGEGKEAWGLAKAYATTDAMNLPAVGFEMDDRGAELFAAFTKANIGNVVAIVVDGKVISVPVIRAAIGKQGTIPGQFSEQEVQALVQALKAGMPPAHAGPATHPASGSGGQVLEGVGHKGLIVGMSVQEVLDMFGPPDKRQDSDKTHAGLQYRQSRGIDILFIDGKAREIRFDKGFAATLSRGAGIGTPMETVLKTYGQPIRTVVTVEEKFADYGDRVLCKSDSLLGLGASSKIEYTTKGVLFRFDTEGKVKQFVVFAPYGEPATQPAPGGAATQPAGSEDEKAVADLAGRFVKAVMSEDRQAALSLTASMPGAGTTQPAEPSPEKTLQRMWDKAPEIRKLYQGHADLLWAPQNCGVLGNMAFATYPTPASIEDVLAAAMMRQGKEWKVVDLAVTKVKDVRLSQWVQVGSATYGAMSGMAAYVGTMHISSDGPTTLPALGSPIERIVAYTQGFPSQAVPGSGAMFLDLDTGSYLKFGRLPDSGTIRKSGVDICYERPAGEEAGPRLATSGMQMQPLSKETGWQSDLKTVRHALMVASPYALTASETAPVAFSTGDGGIGILQIVNVADNPPGVTIRYKLLQAGPAAATQPATQPAWSETTQKAAEALRTDVAHFSLELRAAMWSQEGVGRLGNRSVVMDTVLLLSVLEEKVKGQSRARVVDKVHALKIIDLLTEQGWLEARQAYKPAEKEPYWVLKFGGTEPVQTSLRAGDANAVRLLKTIRDLLGKDDGAAVDEAINSAMRPATQPAPTDTEAQEFYIMGEVERPGVYSLGGRRITVKMALAAAGFALGKKKDMAVVLIRRLNDSSEQQVVLNVDALIAGGQQDVLLRKGDVVVVQPAKDVLDDNAKWGAPRPALNPTASSQPADTASPSATTAKALGLDGDAGQEVPPHAVQPAKADLFYGRDEKPGGAVTILGGVNRSGKYSIDANGMRIADALAKAGYVSQTSIRYAYVVRQGPGAKPIAVDLPKLMDGDPRVNVVLRDGDTVFVPPVVPGEFYIMGEVDRPGVYSLTGRKINVKMALAAAGFPLGKKRDMIVVLVRRKGDGSEQRQTLNVDAILAGAEQDIVLQRDDLLMVRPAKDAATSTSSGQAAQSATQPAPAKGSGHATDANTVSVLGSVPRPGTYPLSAVGTVRKLLLSCGYKQVGKWDRLYIIHPADRQNVKWVVDPQKVLDGSANDIPLAAGEILFVEDVRKTMNRDAEPATQPATLSWGKGPVRIQQGDSVIEGKRIAIEDGHMQVEGNAILKANNGAEVKADRIDIRPNAAATRPATNGAGTQVVPQSGGNEAGKLTVQGVARDAFAAYERARKDQHHLHIVASTRKLERPAGGDWRATPEQSRTWSWWESPTGGRRRVDYDPEICEWIAGAAPYCETRYLFTFDGKEFRKVDFIYDEHLGLYGARVSERYPHDKPTYFAQTHWATGLVFMAQPPGACERCEQIPNNSVKELTRFSSISDTPLTTARHIQEADRRLIEIKVEVTKPMRMAELIVLDPARGHSLVRSQYWQDGRLEREFAVHEWKQLSDNLWFPMYWTTENGSPEPGKRLKVEYRATVAEYYDPTQSDAIFGLRDVVFGKPLAYPPHGSARKNAAPATQPAPSTASGQTPNGTSTQPGGKINVE